MRILLSLFVTLFILSCSTAFAVPESPVAASERTIAAQPLTTLIAPVPLDKALLEAPNQLKFDSNEWKNSIDKRQHMLVDFYQQNLLRKTPQEIHSLLGEPLQSETNHTLDEFYDLGTYKNAQIFLDVVFLENHLVALSLGQKTHPGERYIVASAWHWENPNNSEIAKELNQHFYIVGASVNHLCHSIGQPTQDGAYWRCGPYQFDCTPNGSRVVRFRVVADGTSTIHEDNEWQDQDLRVNKGSYSTGIDMELLSSPWEAQLAQPMQKFESKRWLPNWSRRFMLFDLTHNYNLVGSTRARIRNLFGPPTFSESSLSINDGLTYGARKKYFDSRISESEPMNKFDWYRLDRPGCTGAEPISNFELVYKNGLVAGYRIIQADFNQLDGKYSLCEQCNDRQGGPVPPLH